MKSILINAALILLLAGCGGKARKGSFELRGKLENGAGKMIYLEKMGTSGMVVIDSTVIEDDGSFEFTNYTPRIGYYRLRENQQNFAMLVLDSTDKAVLEGNLVDLRNTYRVKGSPETELYLQYAELVKARDLRLDSLNKAGELMMMTRPTDRRLMDSLSQAFEAPYNAIVSDFTWKMTETIRRNTDRYSSLMAIQTLEFENNADLFRELGRQLTAKFPHDPHVNSFYDRLQKMLATQMGMTAPEIEMPDTEGNPLKLSSFRGKFVLIDFWASWCGPCRREMPNVVKAYARFRDKGFEIFGVSLDKDRDAWLEAIRKDGITWPQVSDLRHWESSVVRQYQIEGIPYTVLLDPEGRIIARNLRGPDLENKLAEVLR